ncbi:hypothetical protein bcgnr5411_11890 [Bacillus cereus]
MYCTLSSLFLFILSKIEEVILTFPISRKHFPPFNRYYCPLMRDKKEKEIHTTIEPCYERSHDFD